MGSPKNPNSPIGIDFDHFDWSILDSNTEPPEQPYFLKPNVKKSEFQPKIIRADNTYTKEENGVRYSTNEGSAELDKFKKKLRSLQSSFGNFYSSWFDYSITEREYKIKQNKYTQRKDATLKSEV
uniref:Uncharacterized protein n=1 Tax=Panagrolaimus davidi TaxID=227884 RepID=A0A914P3T2_9BILA